MGLKLVVDPESGSIHSEKEVIKETRPVVDEKVVADEKFEEKA